MATPSGSTGAVSPPARPSSATRRRVAPCRDTSRRDGLTSGISKYVRMRWNATSLYASTLTPPTTTVVVVLSVAMRGGDEHSGDKSLFVRGLPKKLGPSSRVV